MNEDLEVIQANFRQIYLDGIPRIIADGTAFLSFVCMITATEALCGYRFGNAYAVPNLGKLFKDFIRSYYPKAYGQYADDLWEFRNKLVHAFSTGRFLLTHHHSERHLLETRDGMTFAPPPIPASLPTDPFPEPFAWTGAPIDLNKSIHVLSGPVSATGDITRQQAVVLNAEDFYSGLLYAAEQYFADVAASSDLQKAMRDRLFDPKGGPIAVREIP